MKLRDRHPQVIAAAILATGAFFLAASILEFSFLQAEPPGVFVLMAVGIVFLLGGSYYLIKATRGQLDPGEKTITDVRLKAITKMDSTELLSQIAREDPDAKVREKALARLEEIVA